MDGGLADVEGLPGAARGDFAGGDVSGVGCDLDAGAGFTGDEGLPGGGGFAGVEGLPGADRGDFAGGDVSGRGVGCDLDAGAGFTGDEGLPAADFAGGDLSGVGDLDAGGGFTGDEEVPGGGGGSVSKDSKGQASCICPCITQVYTAAYKQLPSIGTSNITMRFLSNATRQPSHLCSSATARETKARQWFWRLL